MLEIWTIDLTDLSQKMSSFLCNLLTPEERNRSQKYISPKKGLGFALARGILRYVLSGYVSLPPQDLVFRLSSKGKPELARPSNRMPFFNLSHSRNHVCLAISASRRVGVDIEAMDKVLQRLDKIAAFIFFPHEVEALLTYQAAARLQSFYSLWTSKEAYLKGTGEGLTRLRDISCLIRCASTFLYVLGIQGAGRWRLHHFQPAPHILGTVAVEGDGSVLITHRKGL